MVKALRLVAEGLAVVTEKRSGGKPSVIRLHQHVVREVNREWRKKASYDRNASGETLDRTKIPVRNAGGASVLQLSELIDRKHTAQEYDQDQPINAEDLLS